LVFANPMPTNETIENLYKNGVSRWASPEEYKSSRTKYFDYFIEQLKQYAKGKSNRLLDYGAGIGYFLEKANNAGWCGIGIELSSSDRKIAKAKKLDVRDITEFSSLKPGTIDVCTMFDVLEHLKYPNTILQKVRQVLKPNGIIVIDTGDISGLPYIFAKERNPFVQNEGHIMLYTPKSVAKLLENNGYRIFRIASESEITSDKKTNIINRIKRKFISRPNMFIFAHMI